MLGKFIAFEGIDGAGLTTQSQLLEKYLKSKGFVVVLTKEPTNGLIGGLIKAGLKHEWKTTNLTLQLLFSADRAHHLETEIIPALNEGKIVISDRYLFSTLAYGMVDLDKDWLEALNKKFLIPDATFILDLPVEVAIQRIKASRFGFELFEQKERLEKVRENFLYLAKEYPNCFVIDAWKPIQTVASSIRQIVDNLLNKK